MEQMIEVRLVDGKYRLKLVRTTDTGRVVVFTPPAFWRRKYRREIGGIPPRPLIGPSARHDGLSTRRVPR